MKGFSALAYVWAAFMSPEYLHDKVLASPDELILCVNYCLKEPEILKNKDYQVKALN